MDQNTYRQELDEVRYTEAGRTALVEQLMAAQAAEQPARRKGWGRKGVVMVLAAVLLVTAAAVATAAPVWLAYFGGLDEQQAVVENMETTESGLPPAAESEGVTIAPLSILGSKNQLYIMLEIRAPEGTVFTEDGGYHLHSTVKPKVKPTGMAVHSGRFTILDAGTKEPNVLTCVDEISASYDLGGGTYCISGLDGRETSEWIFEGEWNFPLPEDLTGNQVLKPEAAGVTVETEQGTFTLDSISVSPLGIWWQYRFDGTNGPVTDQFVYKRDVYGDLCFGIDDLTFTEDGYARAAYWSYNDETFVLAVYKDENGDTWGRAFRVPEELVWSGDCQKLLIPCVPRPATPG